MVLFERLFIDIEVEVERESFAERCVLVAEGFI